MRGSGRGEVDCEPRLRGVRQLPEGGAALGDVDVLRVGLAHAVEELPGASQVAGALLEVGEGIPEAQVVLLGLPDHVGPLAQQCERVVDPALSASAPA